jgi:hypothetical protein
MKPPKIIFGPIPMTGHATAFVGTVVVAYPQSDLRRLFEMCQRTVEVPLAERRGIAWLINYRRD